MSKLDYFRSLWVVQKDRIHYSPPFVVVKETPSFPSFGFLFFFLELIITKIVKVNIPLGLKTTMITSKKDSVNLYKNSAPNVQLKRS